MDAAEVLAVLGLLGTAGHRVGISGGWGVDALLGRRTRPHADLDLAVPAGELDAIVGLLGGRGYRVRLDERPARLELAAADGRAIDLHPVRWAADGSGRQVGFGGRVFVYPPGGLEAVGRIAGRPVSCATPELQLAFHLGYEPTAVDRADMEALAAAVGLELPPPYGPEPPAPGGPAPGRPGPGPAGEPSRPGPGRPGR